MPNRLLRSTAAIAFGGLALALPACGGDSAEQTAQQKVCTARTDIKKQVDDLKAMTPATVTADGVRTNLQAIRDDLGTIKAQRDKVADDRRQGIDEANDAFKSQIREVASTVLRSTSAQEARTQVKGAIDQLGGAYQDTLAGMDCSG